MKIKLHPAIILVLSAELLFSTTSVLVKYMSQAYGISAVQAAFFRFLIGFILVGGYLLFTKQKIKAVNKKMLISRGVMNTIAVFFYYIALQYTTLTKANLLNMTYPLFIALLAPLLLKEKTSLYKFVLLAIAALGIYLVLDPNFQSVNIGDLLALISGFSAAFAIMSLRAARKTDSTLNVLAYLMVIGLFANGLFIKSFIFPSAFSVLILSICGFFGVAGQYLLTKGYSQLTAIEGSITSKSRIVFAGIYGVLFFNEIITIKLLAGAILIAYATIFIKKSAE